MAALYGQVEVFKILVNEYKKQGKIIPDEAFISIVRYSDKIGTAECLDFLLANYKKGINFDYVEPHLNSNVLHYAVRYSKEEHILEIMKHMKGGFLFQENIFHIMPIHEMNGELLEKYFDECVVFNLEKYYPFEEELTVKIDFHGLITKQGNDENNSKNNDEETPLLEKENKSVQNLEIENQAEQKNEGQSKINEDGEEKALLVEDEKMSVQSLKFFENQDNKGEDKEAETEHGIGEKESKINEVGQQKAPLAEEEKISVQSLKSFKNQCNKEENEEIQSCQLPDMDFINIISHSPEHKHLLNHPLITTYLLLKWHAIRKIYYSYTISYAVFYILFILHCIFNYTKVEEDINKGLTYFICILLFIILVFSTIIEIIQIRSNIKVYFKTFDNYLELLVILLTFLTFLPFDKNFKIQISAFCILISSFTFLFLIGQNPHMSVITAVLREVVKSYLKLFVWYAIILFSFAISFYIMFFDPEDEENFFKQFLNQFLK